MQGALYEIKRVAIIVEELLQVCFFWPTRLLTAALCVNSAGKSLDATAFVRSWTVAVKMENNVGVSLLTIDGCFKVA